MENSNPPSKSPSKHYGLNRQELALVCVTMVWGGTFLTVHTAMLYAPPFFFVSFRFFLASLFTAMVFWRCMSRMTFKEIQAGSLIGVAIFLGYGLQTWGLQSIPSSQSGFITALYVPMVPLLQWVVLRRPPHIMSWAGIVLAFSGLVLLSGPGAGSISLNKGEIATLLGALAIASEIILISRFASTVDTRRVTVVQLFVAGALSLMTMPLNGESFPEFSWYWLICGVGLAAASALIQLAMNWAQKSVSPTKATIIYAGEPVWAGVIGWLAGELMPALAFAGALLIVAGVITSEIRPTFLEKKEAS
ncbi:DMT family transporter [Pantoea sp. Acro-805]|uniref:DMT family transporter n=1 Tax=Candidatus Pantoea formicae TaxID=2608355 RepID=A0ABX0R8Y6_9GAMM|nr:DMT family transporter [Pantoea formicae]NIF03731.1 DMT family transporter [Pantoea formicae]